MPTSKSKQPDANRLNSEQTSGPLPIDGDATFRFNALIHAGDLDSEKLAAEYRQRYNPSSFHEHFLVDSLARQGWRLRQLRAVEGNIWEHAANIVLKENPVAGVTSVAAFRALLRIQRVMESCQDHYYRTMKELHRLQARQTQPSKATSKKLASFRQKAQTAPGMPPPTGPNPTEAA
jgi:hypothetical protein